MNKNIEKITENIYKLRIKIFKKNNPEIKQELIQMIEESKNSQKELLDKFDSNNFFLKMSNYKGIDYVQKVNLKYNIDFPIIYSVLAIEKAFNTGIIQEDKLFIEYYLVTVKVINDIIKGKFTKQYIVEFSESLFNKKEKINRLLKLIENPAIQDKVSIKTTYNTFIKNKEAIYELMRNGFRIAIILDESFDIENENIEKLRIFKFILVNKNLNYCSRLMKNKDQLTNLIEV